MMLGTCSVGVRANAELNGVRSTRMRREGDAGETWPRVSQREIRKKRSHDLSVARDVIT